MVRLGQINVTSENTVTGCISFWRMPGTTWVLVCCTFVSTFVELGPVYSVKIVLSKIEQSSGTTLIAGQASVDD